LNEIYLYLLTLPVFFAIDMLWLGLIAKNIYQEQLGHYLKTNPNWPAAIIFYLIYIIGIIIFAVLPNINKEPPKAAIFGALFGFFAYATYDLTNYSTIKNWPLGIVIIDIIWGTILTSTVALVSYFIAKWLY